MINLKRIIEQQEVNGQYYDLGGDFSNFKRVIDGTSEQIKQKFESTIGSKLVGKRVRARASRGYKQFVKDYEFDVTRITLDDYYDNYVIVAHDNSTPKPKEYFLKPGFKIQILGPATGQPSPQKGGKDNSQLNQTNPITPKTNPDKAQAQPMSPAPAGHVPSEEPMTEDAENGEANSKPSGDVHEGYPIENIIKDIEGWLPRLLAKPQTSMRDFVKSIGWIKDGVAMYDIKIPANMLKYKIKPETLNAFFGKLDRSKGKFGVQSMKMDDSDENWIIRIQKIKAS